MFIFVRTWLLRLSLLLMLPTLIYFFDQTLLIPSEGIHIIADEGVKFKVYKDHLGNLTGGVGHLLNARDRETYQEGDYISSEQIRKWLIKDYHNAREVSEEIVPNANDELKNIFTSLAFNLGETRLRKFKKTIKFINNNNCLDASKELLRSKAANQNKNRYKRISERIRYAC